MSGATSHATARSSTRRSRAAPVTELHLAEFGTARNVPLDTLGRDALIATGITLSPEPGPTDRWKLRAGSYVGAIVIPGMVVRIQPKVGVANLFAMLSAASGCADWSRHETRFARDTTTDDIAAAALLRAVSRQLQSGTLRGYTQVEEESSIVRGRIDWTESLRRRPAAGPPFVQSPEFLHQDIPENRIIAAAIRCLSRRVKTQSLLANLRNAARTFADVSPLARGAPLPRFTRHRLNARWWGVIDLALLILRGDGFDLPLGAHASRAFLLDMNIVFERFVHQSLADRLLRSGKVLHSNRTGLTLDEGKLHRVRPDLSLWSGPTCTFAADCKYKDSNLAEARREDIYQALAYSAATGLPRIMLIYPGPSSGASTVRIRGGSTQIQVRTLNLAAPARDLSAQLDTLAAEIASA